ncbi:hypothetical protein NECAME_05547 [Necator americanus]|uniref:Transcription factor E2F/dimerization partner n=1 Tax=Necator americanus TaxID=51031 RepID=W2SGA8_NECAM|nr:hypothetical protein NECAME_05547 [Necator americanus]ETN68583.1 hypothetical protein NECAME_05547 [Necator americanus]
MMASRPNNLLGCDLPVENKHLVDRSMGLRHFSTKVCEKVKEKGRTNYNQASLQTAYLKLLKVADELVAEYFAANNMNSDEFLERQKFDQKNIRRRVYDALNVLLAMNIICKRKKDIDWVGLPATKAGEIKRYEEEKAKLQERIRRKKETIQELIVQLVAYKSLNNFKYLLLEHDIYQNPPYVKSFNALVFYSTTVDCAVSGDRSEFLFHFDQPFEVHDDFEALKRLGYSYGLEHNALNPEMMEHIDEFIPPALRGYIPKILGGEMSDWESRTRSNPPPLQYVIREPSQGEKLHTSMFDLPASDHSSDGSYAEMSQPIYTVPDGYAYALPAYETELGEEIDLVEDQGDYTSYSAPGTSTSYEVISNTVDRSRPLIAQPTTCSIPRLVSTADVPEYSSDRPSTSKGMPRATLVKRPIFAVGNSVYGKMPVEVQHDIGYAPTVQPSKRAKTGNPVYNL